MRKEWTVGYFTGIEDFFGSGVGLLVHWTQAMEFTYLVEYGHTIGPRAKPFKRPLPASCRGEVPKRLNTMDLGKIK